VYFKYLYYIVLNIKVKIKQRYVNMIDFYSLRNYSLILCEKIYSRIFIMKKIERNEKANFISNPKYVSDFLVD